MEIRPVGPARDIIPPRFVPAVDPLGSPRTPSPAKSPRAATPRYPARPEGVKVSQLPPPTEAEQAERIAGFRRIVETGTMARLAWISPEGKRRTATVDLTTASLVVQAFDRLTPANRAVMANLEPPAMIRVVFRLIR